MRVLVVVSGILPYPRASSGNPVVTWAVVKSLLDRGHTVSICTFHRWRYDLYRDEARAYLEQSGVRVYDLDEQAPPQHSNRPSSAISRYLSALRQAVAPRASDYFPQVAVAPLLADAIAAEQPEALYVYDFPAAAVVAELSFVPPRLTALVNLNHLHGSAMRRGIQTKGLRSWVNTRLTRLADRSLARIELRVIRTSEWVVGHAAHHAAWLREQGIEQCFYLPNPVVDNVGSRWQELRQAYWANNGKPIILFIGRLDSIINRPALNLLAFEILPVLEQELGTEGFQLDIVGAGELLPAIEDRLNHPSVRIRGFIEDAQAEFLRSDVLIVPTPDPLGFRTRVAEGFSYGCCVVSHTSNALGMPELVHEDNALLASDGLGLARQTVRALRDPDLRNRLQRRARETYEAKLDAAKVCGRIAAELEALARQHVTPTGDKQS